MKLKMKTFGLVVSIIIVIIILVDLLFNFSGVLNERFVNNNLNNEVYIYDKNKGAYLANLKDRTITTSDEPFKWHLYDKSGEKVNTLTNVNKVQFKKPNSIYYLHKPANSKRLTTWHTGEGNIWTISDGKIIGFDNTLLNNIPINDEKYNFSIEFVHPRSNNTTPTTTTTTTTTTPTTFIPYTYTPTTPTFTIPTTTTPTTTTTTTTTTMPTLSVITKNNNTNSNLNELAEEEEIEEIEDVEELEESVDPETKKILKQRFNSVSSKNNVKVNNSLNNNRNNNLQIKSIESLFDGRRYNVIALPFNTQELPTSNVNIKSTKFDSFNVSGGLISRVPSNYTDPAQSFKLVRIDSNNDVKRFIGEGSFYPAETFPYYLIKAPGPGNKVLNVGESDISVTKSMNRPNERFNVYTEPYLGLDNQHSDTVNIKIKLDQDSINKIIDGLGISDLNNTVDVFDNDLDKDCNRDNWISRDAVRSLCGRCNPDLID